MKSRPIQPYALIYWSPQIAEFLTFSEDQSDWRTQDNYEQQDRNGEAFPVF
jgi:hypothetical protein